MHIEVHSHMPAVLLEVKVTFLLIGISSELHQVQALQLLTLLLPEAHRETLRVHQHALNTHNIENPDVSHSLLKQAFVTMITGSPGLPPKGGLSSRSEPDVSVECLHGDGSKPIFSV